MWNGISMKENEVIIIFYAKHFVVFFLSDWDPRF